MPLRQALATSPNTAFVILEEKTGLDAVVDMASRLGMRRTMATNIAGIPPDPKGDNELRVSQAEYYKSNGNASFTLGPASLTARKAGRKRPMMGKTDTTEEYKSAAYLGATPDYAGAVQVFNDSTSPKGICVGAGPPRLCASDNVYGGTMPAATWFDTMTKVHADLPEKPLPEVEDRYRHGDGQMKVPDVVGSDITRAAAVLKEAGYQVTTVQVSSPQPPGAVVAQSPQGIAFRGTAVRWNRSASHRPARRR